MKLATSKMAPALRWFVVAGLVATPLVRRFAARELQLAKLSLPRSLLPIASTLIARGLPQAA